MSDHHNKAKKGFQSLTSRKEPQTPPELEKAVHILLKPPHIDYIREIDAGFQEDPNYLYNHEFSVSTTIQRILNNAGIHWKPEIMKSQWPRALRIALHKVSKTR